MTDHVLNLACACNKSSFPEGFTAPKYGPLIWGQGAVDKNPEGNATVSGKRLILEVGFALEVHGKWHGTTPGGAVQFPCLYLLLLSWLKEGEVGGVA